MTVGKENEMNYQEFVNHMQENVQESLPECDIQVVQNSKNNGIVYTGLMFHKKERGQEEVINPVIYLENSYQNYRNGESLENITEGIKYAYREGKNSTVYTRCKGLADQEITGRVRMVLVNAERNQERLKELPHRLVEDLAVIYRLHMGKDENGLYSAVINQSMLDYWKMTEEELFDTAMACRKELAPYRLQFLFPDTLVLTNQEQIEGAACLLYPEALEEISGRLGGNFVILPSSIHEIIAMESRGADPERLNLMVKEVNETAVAEDEILSDHAYFYHVSTQKLSSLKNEAEETFRMQGPGL